jgi:hypothetical protein
MSAKLIPYSKDSRVLIQQAEATIQSILDAIVELVTNCNDSYSRGKYPFGKIEIYASREKRSKCKELKIRDYAEGMNREKLEKAMTYGEDSSGFKEGKSVRGLLGRGLKEAIIAPGEGLILTKRNGALNIVKIWREGRYAFYDFIEKEDLDQNNQDIDQFINSKENGTLIKIFVKNEKYTIPESSDRLKLQIENHYALRDINSAKNREIILTFEDFGRRKTKTSSPIKYNPLEGKPIIDESFLLPDYKDLIQLKIYESPKSLSFERYNPCSVAGILIKTKDAVLDNQLFNYAGDSAAYYFWGEAYCDGIAERLREAIKEGKESEIIDLTRKGLNWRSDYCKAIQKSIEKYLSPLIQKKKQSLESGEKRTTSRKTGEMLKNVCKLLDKLAREEFKEWEGPEDPTKLEVKSLIIIPTKANIEIGEPRTLSIYAPKELIKEAGVKTIIMSDCSDIKIVFPGTKRLVMYLELNLKPHPKDPNIYYNFFKVRGRELDKQAYISCKLGHQEASTLVVVKKPTKRKKGKKGGFIQKIEEEYTSDPTQRVMYEKGIINIYVKFPGVVRYFPSGLKEIEQRGESRVMLAELVGESFCKVLAGKKLEEIGGIPGGPEAQIAAFNSEVNKFQKKYLDKIHEIIFNWKFKQ